MSEHQYQDTDGNPCSLDKLCRIEPEWAANQVRGLNTLLTLMKCESVAEAEGAILAMQHNVEDLGELLRDQRREEAVAQGAAVGELG